MTAVGKPSYTNGFTRKNAWYLEEGNNYARILPPVKSLAEKGVWALYEKIHWGLLNSEGKKRTFKCIEVRGKDKMIKVHCPMCDLIATRQHERDVKAQEFEKQGLGPDTIKNKLKPLDEWLKAFNADSKWYVNILKPTGEIGRLSFAHTYKKALDVHIGKLVNPEKGRKPVDPIAADEGVIFNFYYKKGNQKTRVQTVEIYQEEIDIGNGNTAQVIKKLPLTEQILNRLEAESWDLVGMNKVLAAKDIQALVDSGFDSSLVDALFTAPKVTDSTDDDEPTEEESAPATVAKTTPAPQVKFETETAPAPVETKSAAPKSMSDDDFFKRFSGNA